MFAELLTWSNFSFLRGASHPEELVDQARSLGIDALGLCDRNGLYGAVRAWVRAREVGQRLLVGAELVLAPLIPSGPETTLVFYPEDSEGYRQLCRLITRAHAQRPKGPAMLGWPLLEQDLSSLIVIAPIDTVHVRVLETLFVIAKHRTYLAVHHHLDGRDLAREREAEVLAHRFGFPILATARVRWHRPERKALADVLSCVRRGALIEDSRKELYPNREACLASEANLLRRFARHPDWVSRTWEVAERYRFDFSQLSYRFPCHLGKGESADQKLAELTAQGARCRYPTGVPVAVEAQLTRELRLIETLGMAAYFLSTWEIVQMARARGILCQGRGSAANSAVCYALGITAVDPAKSSLLFERFMSVERREPPDIDIDFEHERREEIIQDIYRCYGRDHAAMVSEVIRYRGRSALRDVGKVFGLSKDQLDRMVGTLQGWWAEPRECAARFEQVGIDPKDRRISQSLSLAGELLRFPRHLSIHVGGFLLSAEPLERIAPLEPATMPNRTIVGWDKDDIEELGFFKVDVLGLGILTAIRKTLQTVHAGGDLQTEPEEPFDPIQVLARVPSEERAVYDMLARADTVGVFQIESRAQMAMLPRLRPACFYDLVIEVAIVRPGPIHGKMVHPYLKRRSGQEPIGMPHPELRPILARTLGVPLFQEQVMQIAMVGAGYTGGEADQLRRDMAAFKKTGRLLAHRERLLEGFARKGIEDSFGTALFEQIKGFGEYGFPESHAASFALLVYVSAWLKVHYPAQFAAALLNSQPMGFYSPHSILRDAERHAVRVRDVDVTRSHWETTLEGDPGVTRQSLPPALRLGFHSLCGFGVGAAQRIISARKHGAFQDLQDFRARTGLAKDELSVLAEAGALQKLVFERRQALWQARAPTAVGLWVGVEGKGRPVVFPALDPLEKLCLDYQHKGLSIGDHPMAHLRDSLARRHVLTASELNEVREGQLVRVAGLVLCRQQPMTSSGILFVTLEDETGSINLIVKKEIQERYSFVLSSVGSMLAIGTIQRSGPPGVKSGSTIHVIVKGVEALDRTGRLPRYASRDYR